VTIDRGVSWDSCRVAFISQEEEKNPVFSLQITVGSSSETIVSTMQPEPHWTVLYQVKI